MPCHRVHPCVLVTVLLLTACADDGPPPAAAIEATSPVTQNATVGRGAPAIPAVLVRDRSGNPLPGVRVSFRVAAGGGSVGRASVTTDVGGRAGAQSWILGTVAGEQVVEAIAGGLPPVRFLALAAPGPVASLVAVSGNGQVGTVGSAIQAPTVLATDEFDNAAAGHQVRFQVAEGNGTVQGGLQAVRADGTAMPSEWRLGTVAGPNAVTATVAGLPTVTFTATGIRGAAAALHAVPGTSRSGSPGAPVADPPAVQVHDGFGNGVPGATAFFAVEGGGGSLSGATVTTNSDGVAILGDWMLGESIGTHVVRVTSDSVPGDTVRFEVAVSDFEIEIRYLTGLTPSQRDAFEKARATWRSALRGDLSDVALTNAPCGAESVTDVVDDVLILAEVGEFDGPGNVLGLGGPCIVRDANSLPVLGIVSFDQADLAAIEALGLLDELVEHEVGHVLGIGTLWAEFGLLAGGGSFDPFFTGNAARQAFLDVGGGVYTGSKVPVENSGGAGTRDVHWRESLLHTELMTGFLNEDAAPLSIVSIASLADLGYDVDLGVADAYTFPGAGLQGQTLPRGIPIIEAPPPAPLRVDARGEVRP